MAPLSSVLAGRIPWTQKPGGLQSVHGVAESDTTERLIDNKCGYISIQETFETLRTIRS